MRSEVAKNLNLDQIRYSQVWEDHLLLERGLRPGPKDDVLSIGSAGDNVLALLLGKPRSLTAIDMSPAHSSLLELKLAGIRCLQHDEFASLLGLRDDHDRLSLYSRIQGSLPPYAQEFWQDHGELLQAGLHNAGRLESYFQVFRSEHLPQICDPRLIELFLQASDMKTQAGIFARIATPAFRDCFCWYFGRNMMEKHGRDPAQFKHVANEDVVGSYFFGRFRYACTQIPIRGNFYLESFLTGHYRDLNLAPPYLQPSGFAKLKTLVDRVNVVTDELENHLDHEADGRYNKANLSDIFEYMSEDLSDRVFSAIAKKFRKQGRLVYWNLLVPRQRPDKLAEQLSPQIEEAKQLWQQDRSWFYRDFHIEELI